jgi:hypothetical protein
MDYYQFICHETKEEYGSFETIYMDREELLNDEWFKYVDDEERDTYYKLIDPDNGEEVIDNIDDYVGWYWVAGFPGCLWDGTPMGPFFTEERAIQGAQDND